MNLHRSCHLLPIFLLVTLVSVTECRKKRALRIFSAPPDSNEVYRGLNFPKHIDHVAQGGTIGLEYDARRLAGPVGSIWKRVKKFFRGGYKKDWNDILNREDKKELPREPWDKPVGRPREDPVGKPREDPVGKPREDHVGKPREEPVGRPWEDPVGKSWEDDNKEVTEDDKEDITLKDEDVTAEGREDDGVADYVLNEVINPRNKNKNYKKFRETERERQEAQF